MKRFMLSLLLCICSIFIISQSVVALTLVTDRGTLGGDDFIDWGQLGAPFTVVTNPSPVVSDGGLGAIVSKESEGPLERRNQSNGWSGNFAPGDELIWTRNTTGAMKIEFDDPVFGAGAQIQADLFGVFTGTIEAYDSLNNLLGSFNLAGNSTSAGNNSAIFLGVLSDSINIDHILYYIGSRTQDFAINQLDLVTSGNGVPIPEPATLLLLGSGLIGLGYFVRKRIKK